MRSLSQTKQFARDVKRMRKRGKDLDKLQSIVLQLANDKPLDPIHRDHPLVGNWRDSRDCHIEPNWILIYTEDSESVRLERTGSHSDLFR
ncbi:MAG: type II toxin-antitoxin system YafQ family toxin [Candidatus Omnitrophica bacterium]|nr:type II toxin-antitoxin system YafQ family toxin [Candidatus Omnitrophota bacterium]